MKLTILALAGLALVALGTGCYSSDADDASTASMKDREDVATLAVSGMT